MLKFKDVLLISSKWWLKTADMDVSDMTNLPNIEKSAFLPFQMEIKFLAQFVRK